MRSGNFFVHGYGGGGVGGVSGSGGWSGSDGSSIIIGSSGSGGSDKSNGAINYSFNNTMRQTFPNRSMDCPGCGAHKHSGFKCQYCGRND